MNLFSTIVLDLLIYGYIITLILGNVSAINNQNAMPQPAITYSRSFLLNLWPNCTTPCPKHRDFNNIGNESPRPARKRGRRGGLREKNKRRKTRPYLPTILFTNTRSMCNKLDETSACCRYQHEYRDACLLAFSETWFHENIPERSTEINGFAQVRHDRTSDSMKKGGGGVCLHVNKNWAHENNTTVKERLCTPDIEILTVKIRPFYLPREFTCVIVNVIYIPPSAKSDIAIDTLTSRIVEQEAQAPDAVNLILGDFNHRRLGLNHFHQYVTCKTRFDTSIDHCYGNVADAYKSFALPPIGESDHNVIQLIPKYRPKLKTIPTTVKSVKICNTETIERLQDCFDLTDWDIFINTSVDINEMCDVISSYINFCEDSIIQKKEVKYFGNDKPWITKDLKHLLKEKRLAFRNNDFDKLKAMKQKVKEQINVCKDKYKEKIENQFKSNDMRNMWGSMKKIMGTGKVKNKIYAPNERDYANELNQFYCRFDTIDFNNDHKVLIDMMKEKSIGSDVLIVKEESVEALFRSVNVRKASGPDNISGRILKHCSTQLTPIFTFLFNLSLSSHSIPTIWKTSEVIPIPKKPKINVLNDLRPVALTSIVFKCFEKIIKREILTTVSGKLDFFQFAYTNKRSVEDAVAVFLNEVLKHLEIPKTYVRSLFIDFSSAFNTIQPHILVRKLLELDVNVNIASWVMNFLIERPQYVKLNNTVSDTLLTNTGAPQGCVLSPILYIIYTNDCVINQAGSKLIKFADDSSIIGLIGNTEEEYFNSVQSFVTWCDSNFLQINVSKTKELIFDFRKDTSPISPLVIKNETVETVNDYKYLGMTIDNKLSWDNHLQLIIKKCNQRLYLLRKLKSFKVRSQILNTFYVSAIQSLLTFGIICYGGNLNEIQRKKVNKITKMASKINNSPSKSFEVLYNEYVSKKAVLILEDPSHPLNNEYIKSARSQRLLSKKSRTDRYKNSFIPSSIRLIQQKYSRSFENVQSP